MDPIQDLSPKLIIIPNKIRKEVKQILDLTTDPFRKTENV